MPERIPQTTTIRIPFYAVLSSDHITPATGKTIAVTISKNGAAFGNLSGGATNATEIASGWYYVDLSTTDTGTLGPLIVLGTQASIDNSTIAYNVVSAANGGLTNLDVASSTLATPTNITAGTITTVANLTNAPTNGDLTTTMKSSVTTAATAATPTAAAVTGAVGSVTGNVGGNVTGSVGSVVGAVGSVTGAVGSVTGNVGGSVASVTARVTANTDELAGQTVTAAAGVTFPAAVASPTNITAGTITTVSGNVSGSVNSVVSRVTANVDEIDGAAWSTHAVGMAPSDLRDILGSPSVGAAGFVGIDWAHVDNPASVVDLSHTSILSAGSVIFVGNIVPIGSFWGTIGGIS